MPQTAGGAKNQVKRFDISSPNTFENFNTELITHVGMHCDGTIISAMRKERLDYAFFSMQTALSWQMAENIEGWMSPKG